MEGSSTEARLLADTKILVVADPRTDSGIDRHWVDLDLRGTGFDEALKEFYEVMPGVVLIDCPEDAGAAVGLVEMLRVMSDVPILAMADTCDAGIHALRAGADSVVPKPVSHEELVLRLRRLLARSDGRPARLGDEYVELDHVDREVVVSGTRVDLTPTEFRLLAAFMENPGVVLSHQQLLQLAWGDLYRARSEVKLYVSYLRKSFAPTAVDPIVTVRGVGYAYRPRRRDAEVTG